MLDIQQAVQTTQTSVVSSSKAYFVSVSLAEQQLLYHFQNESLIFLYVAVCHQLAIVTCQCGNHKELLLHMSCPVEHIILILNRHGRKNCSERLESELLKIYPPVCSSMHHELNSLHSRNKNEEEGDMGDACSQGNRSKHNYIRGVVEKPGSSSAPVRLPRMKGVHRGSGSGGHRPDLNPHFLRFL